jgi:hypothetical protein
VERVFARGIKKIALIGGGELGTMNPLVEWILESDKVLTYSEKRATARHAHGAGWNRRWSVLCFWMANSDPNPAQPAKRLARRSFVR